MACSDCGAKRGHLNGCPRESSGKDGRENEKRKKGKKRRSISDVCPANKREWGPHSSHVCGGTNNHTDNHRCFICGCRW